MQSHPETEIVSKLLLPKLKYHFGGELFIYLDKFGLMSLKISLKPTDSQKKGDMTPLSSL